MLNVLVSLKCRGTAVASARAFSITRAALVALAASPIRVPSFSSRNASAASPVPAITLASGEGLLCSARVAYEPFFIIPHRAREPKPIAASPRAAEAAVPPPDTLVLPPSTSCLKPAETKFSRGMCGSVVRAFSFARRVVAFAVAAISFLVILA